MAVRLGSSVSGVQVLNCDDSAARPDSVLISCANSAVAAAMCGTHVADPKCKPQNFTLSI